MRKKVLFLYLLIFFCLINNNTYALEFDSAGSGGSNDTLNCQPINNYFFACWDNASNMKIQATFYTQKGVKVGDVSFYARDNNGKGFSDPAINPSDEVLKLFKDEDNLCQLVERALGTKCSDIKNTYNKNNPLYVELRPIYSVFFKCRKDASEYWLDKENGIKNPNYDIDSAERCDSYSWSLKDSSSMGTANQIASWLSGQAQQVSEPGDSFNYYQNDAESRYRGLINPYILGNFAFNFHMTSSDINTLRTTYGYKGVLPKGVDVDSDRLSKYNGGNGDVCNSLDRTSTGSMHSDCYSFLRDIDIGGKAYGVNWLRVSDYFTPPPEEDDEPDDSLDVWEYNYKCYSSLKVCTMDEAFKEKIDKNLVSLSKGKYIKNLNDENSKEYDVVGDCVLYNPRYATSNGSIYCSETLVTDLQSLVTNLKAVTSGMFIPIAKNKKPSIGISATCYIDASDDTKEEEAFKTELESYVKTKYNELKTNIFLQYFDDNQVEFVSGQGNISYNLDTDFTDGVTEYQLPYYSLSFTATYNYIPKSKKNPYVDKFTAQGTDSLKPSKSNENLSDVNFKTPVLKATGTYLDAIKVSLLTPITNDGLFDRMLSGLEGNVVHLTNKDSCPGKCLKQILGTDSDEVDKAKEQFDEDYKNEYDLVFSSRLDYCSKHVGGWTTCYSDESPTGYDCWDKDRGACTQTTYYYNITFETEHSSACKNLGGKFTPTNPDGCYVELNFENGFIGNKPSNYDCSLDTVVTNQLTICSQDSPTYNPQTGTCDKQPFDKLVFRPIDLSNPFPGYNGTGRVSGSNWTTEDIKKYITDRQDVYTKEPLYTVTLTPTKIKEIREYNKEHDYDDFELECTDGNSRACYSSFIRDYLDEDKSRCYNGLNQNKNTFDACASYN